MNILDEINNDSVKLNTMIYNLGRAWDNELESNKEGLKARDAVNDFINKRVEHYENLLKDSLSYAEKALISTFIVKLKDTSNFILNVANNEEPSLE